MLAQKGRQSSEELYEKVEGKVDMKIRGGRWALPAHLLLCFFITLQTWQCGPCHQKKTKFSSAIRKLSILVDTLDLFSSSFKKICGQ